MQDSLLLHSVRGWHSSGGFAGAHVIDIPRAAGREHTVLPRETVKEWNEAVSLALQYYNGSSVRTPYHS